MNVYGRQLLLYDADDATRTWLRTHVPGLSEAQLTPFEARAGLRACVYARVRARVGAQAVVEEGCVRPAHDLERVGVCLGPVTRLWANTSRRSHGLTRPQTQPQGRVYARVGVSQ